jgi:hypothetical protein
MVNAGEHKTAKAALGYVISFAAAYLLAAAPSRWPNVAPDNTATLWPPSALCLAALLLREQRCWLRCVLSPQANTTLREPAPSHKDFISHDNDLYEEDLPRARRALQRRSGL